METNRREFLTQLLAAGAISLPALPAASKELIQSANSDENDIGSIFKKLQEASKDLVCPEEEFNQLIDFQSILRKVLFCEIDEKETDRKTIGCHPQIRASEIPSHLNNLKLRIKRKSATNIAKQEHAYLFEQLEDFTIDQPITSNWQNTLINYCLHSDNLHHVLLINRAMLLEHLCDEEYFHARFGKDDEIEEPFNGYIGQYYTAIDEIDEIDGLHVYADVFTQESITEPRAYLLPTMERTGFVKKTTTKQLPAPNERELRAGVVVFEYLDDIKFYDNDIWRLV